jgi:putative ABC transport system permease protein
MLAELLNSVNNDIAKGMFEAAGAIVLCMAVVGLCRHFGLRVERETAISIARGLVQMVFVGIVLAVLLHGSLLIGATILVGMTFAAAVTASRRAKGIPNSLLLSFYAIAAGGGVVIAGILAMGALTTDIWCRVGSMIIANAMNACGQSIERFKADVTSHVGYIEAALALGAVPAVATAPYFESAVYASLLPRLDMLKSLGLVWIPGVMAGMVVSGASPVRELGAVITVTKNTGLGLPHLACPADSSTRRSRLDADRR